MEDIEEIDISWLDETEKLTNTTNVHNNEMQTEVQLFYIYVNQNLEIEKVIKETQELQKKEELKKSILNRDYVLKIIQTKKNNQQKKYKLHEIVKYNINIEGDKIQLFSNIIHSNPTHYFHKINYMDDIVIEPTIFIFNKLNSVYFIYKEIPSSNHLLNQKPILKITESKGGQIYRKTKHAANNTSYTPNEPSTRKTQRKVGN
jgi:hypothetical protein